MLTPLGDHGAPRELLGSRGIQGRCSHVLRLAQVILKGTDLGEGHASDVMHRDVSPRRVDGAVPTSTSASQSVADRFVSSRSSRTRSATASLADR